MTTYTTPGEAWKVWTRATGKAATIETELKDIRLRIEDGADPGKYTERLANLSRGLDRATDDIKQLGPIAAQAYANGELGEGEPGADGTVEHKANTRRLLGENPSPIAAAMVDAGFSLKSNPSVEMSGFNALKSLTAPAPTSWDRAPRQLLQMGQDRRWLWPHLPTENAGTDSAIEDYSQSARTLTGTVQRELDAVSEKASLDVGLTLVTEKLSQLAVVVREIPNALLESIPRLSAWLASEGEFQVHTALDDHVFAQIVAASPPFGTTGSTLIEQVRNGVAEMRSTGANPSLLVVNPSDAAALDLATDSGGYVFPTSSSGTSSPLWDLRIVERIGAGTEPPYLLDPQRLGVLYLGRLKVDADPFSGFSKNLTDLRIEVNSLFHIRDSNGARRIAAS